MEAVRKSGSNKKRISRLQSMGVFDDLEQLSAGLEGEAGRVHRVLELAKRISKGLGLLNTGVVVQDRNKYEYMAQNLTTILGFENFSLAEYVYLQPDWHKPGLRLWLYRKGGGLGLTVILFPQIGEWQVDDQGGMLRTELVHLDLSGDEPRVLESILDGVDAETPWHEALTEAMCAPLG